MYISEKSWARNRPLWHTKFTKNTSITFYTKMFELSIIGIPKYLTDKSQKRERLLICKEGYGK